MAAAIGIIRQKVTTNFGEWFMSIADAGHWWNHDEKVNEKLKGINTWNHVVPCLSIWDYFNKLVQLLLLGTGFW